MAAALAGCASAAVPVRQVREGGYDVAHITLRVAPDLNAHTIRAEEFMELHAYQTLSELRFDANALNIEAAMLDGTAVSWRAENDKIVLTLKDPMQPGENASLYLRYSGAPARGWVWEENGFYTSYFSCDWMICALDRPGDAFSLHVDLLRLPASWRRFSAERARAYPAHVQGFGAGAWNEVRVRDGATEFVYASGVANEADLRAMFAETPRMARFFEHAAGVPFPHAVFTQFVSRESEAQEGAGFAILGDGVVRAVLTDPHEDWASAHEMAHSYWGNLLTPKDWSHFWLSEGLTTFMTAAWKQQRWGDEDYQREIDLATQRWQRARDAGWDRPLAFAGAYPDLRTRRAIQYSKGMLFFCELRRVLGEDAFWRGIRLYTQAHAGGVVESVDMQHAMEAASGRDLNALFREWVYS
jgi:aminopeptidase N